MNLVGNGGVSGSGGVGTFFPVGGSIVKFIKIS